MAGPEQLENDLGQIVKGADDPVWAQFRDRPLAIAEIDGDDRYPGRPGGGDIGDRIPDHDRARGLPLGSLYGAPQQLRVGFLHAEGVGPADGDEATLEAERLKEPER